MSYTSNNEASMAPSAPTDLSTYTRSMHQYTHAQLGQMRAAISNAAESAQGAMRDADRSEREQQSKRDQVERQRTRETIRVVGQRDFA